MSERANRKSIATYTMVQPSTPTCTYTVPQAFHPKISTSVNSHHQHAAHCYIYQTTVYANVYRMFCTVSFFPRRSYHFELITPELDYSSCENLRWSHIWRYQPEHLLHTFQFAIQSVRKMAALVFSPISQLLLQLLGTLRPIFSCLYRQL